MSEERERQIEFSASPWQQVLIESIARYYPPDERTHGLDHAKKVRDSALKISQEPEYSNLSLDLDILCAGGLLHDTGYSQKKDDWSEDLREHVKESMKIAEIELKEIPIFSNNPEKISKVLWLILNHDNTNFSFPMKGRGGRPAISRRHAKEAEGAMRHDKELNAMISIIKEADSRLQTGIDGAQRTFNFNIKTNIPIFGRGDPLRAWMWGESAVGSVRLAAKSALLDAKTKKGKEIAWKGYLEAEELIKRECIRNGVYYQPELGLEELMTINREEISGELEIIRVYPWEELEGELRRTRLNGDPTLFPYATARIESMTIKKEEVHPLSLYALSDRLKFHRNLRKLFLANYALDPLDLSGIIEFRTEEGVHLISPPLVEISKHDGNKKLLVDGIHRFLSEEYLDPLRIRTIVISEIPEHFPLIPLPLEWSEVKIFDSVPNEAKKRRYRFSNKDELDTSWFSSVEITEKNYLYFFYRKLDNLGSEGIRKTGGKE